MCSYVDIPMKTSPSLRCLRCHLVWFFLILLGASPAFVPLQSEAQVIFSANFNTASDGNLPTGTTATQVGRFAGLPALPHGNAVIQSDVARESGKALRLTRNSTSSPLIQLRQETTDYIPQDGETLDFRFDLLVPRASDSGAFTLAPNGNVVQQFLVVYIKHAGQGSFVSLLNAAGSYVDTSFKIAPDIWYTFEIQVRFEHSDPEKLHGIYDLYITPDGGVRVAVGEGLTTRSFTLGAGIQALLSNQLGQLPATDSVTYWDNLHYAVAVPEASGVALTLLGAAAITLLGITRKRKENS